MFYIRTAFRNMKRHLKKSILYLLICCVIVCILQIYAGNIGRAQKQLRELPAAIPVYAQVVALNGGMLTDITIKESNMQVLESSPQITDRRFTAHFAIAPKQVPPEEWRLDSGHYGVGLTSLKALPGLDRQSIVWADGFDETVLAGNEMVCVADRGLMKQEGWELGSQVKGYQYYLHMEDLSGMIVQYLEPLSYTIVGEADLSAQSGDSYFPVLAVPYQVLKESCGRKGVEFFADSAAFYVKDPHKLNAFKKEMEELGLMSVIPEADYSRKGVALAVEDATFIQAGTKLTESIASLRGFFPLLLAALAAIGYFVSYLVIQSRREEFVTLRILGLNGQQGVGLFLLELLALALLGTGIGVLIGIIFGLGSGKAVWIITGSFFVCFMLGAFMALARLAGIKLMQAIAQTD